MSKTRVAVFLPALLLLVAACSAAPDDSMTGSAGVVAAAAPTWTGTWAASVQTLGGSFRQQTLRHIVHTSIGGTAARVQLSNVFGNGPLVIADVHLAQRAGGPNTVAGSDRAVTFGGQTTVTIPAGGLAVSDTVAFPVTALSDVAVSFYLPEATPAATGHQDGHQTSYIANGDVSGGSGWSGTQTTGSYYFLANLDVQNSASAGAVATLGASITDAVSSGGDRNRRWPNDLAVRIAGSGRTVGVLNQGISGNRLLSDGAGQSALHRFQRDVINQPGVRWVIFSDDPINDVGGGNGPDGPQLIAALGQLIASAHANGIRFLCSTLTPFEGAGGWSSRGETARAAVNAFIRGSSSGCDGIVDQDTATHDPAHPTRYLPAYDAGDHLHPNEAGLQAIADAVNLAFFDAGGPPPPPPPPPAFVAFRAHANGKYVTAEQAGAQPLIANRDAVAGWEQFDLLDQGGGIVVLRARVNGQYVTAESAGTKSLIANRTAIGLWEQFALVHNSDGSISLRAQVNGQYVTADAGGAQPLIANRATIGPSEELDLITN